MDKYRFQKAALFILFTLISLTASEEGAEEEFPLDNGVFVLTDSNFDKFFETHQTVLVEFYAPWCGHCKALAPEYEKAAKVLKSKRSPVSLAKVDATKETALGTKYDIKGYPMLKFFKDGLSGGSVEYDGPREADGKQKHNAPLDFGQ